MKISASLLVFMAAGLTTCEATLFGWLFKTPRVGPPDLAALDNYLSNKMSSDDVESNVKLLESNIKKIRDMGVRSAAQIVLDLAHSKGRCDDHLLETLYEASRVGARASGGRRVDQVLEYHLRLVLSACQEYIKQRIDQMIDSSSEVAKLVRIGQPDETPGSIYDDVSYTLFDVYNLIDEMAKEDSNKIDYYKFTGSEIYFDHEKFEQVRNKFAMPACRELLDQISVPYIGMAAITSIMKGTKPEPFEGPRFKTFKEVLWIHALCDYANGWDSMDTTRLQEELTRNWG